MNKQAKFVALVAALFLAACAQKSGAPTIPSTSEAPASVVTQSIVTHGSFTEYSIPAGLHPEDLTRGPYGTIYFTAPSTFGSTAHVYQLTTATGQIHVFTGPAPYENTGFSSIVSLNRSVVFVVFIPINEDEFFFAHVSPEGAYSFTGAPYLEFGLLTNFALTPSGTNFTFGWCIDPCQGPNNGVAAGTELDDGFIPVALTAGPGGNFYVTARAFAVPQPPGAPDSRVYVISQTAGILHKFALPLGAVGANPAGITVGSDHNLWITEPGINKIARMTPTGALTQFSLPAANAGPDNITGASGAALFFTETKANKIGRITTSGSITEYAIPTAASQPTGIAPCTTACGIHGGAWFTETAGNKIGRFNSPI